MIYIAFLQGINFGKHNRINMPDLKRILEARGLKNVQTYLQNGNVIFESEHDEIFLKKMIEHEIMIIYRYVVPVIVRTIDELETIINNCPFDKKQIKEARSNTGEDLYLVLLNKTPSPEKVNIIKEYSEGNEYIIIDRCIYLLFLNKRMRASLLVRNLTRIDVYATIRDINTINKLLTLAKAKVS